MRTVNLWKMTFGMRGILFALVISLLLDLVKGGGLDEFLVHSVSKGTQNFNQNVSNSGLPHLPKVEGFMGTHGTYRFLSIMEQTGWLIGEPKHGLWRIQENGFVREFRKKGRIGLRDGVEPNYPDLSDANKDIIDTNYAHYIPEESWEGYKYPDDRISKGNGKYDYQQGYLNYIDLSIYHPKYKSKYESHVPIDLPFFYCTMTQNDYPHLWNSWKYAMAQPLANQIGPLGIRAGLDIKENYVNVLRFDFIHDAGIWANVGNNDTNNRDMKITSAKNQPEHAQNVNYQRICLDNMDAEVYLVERMFFNKPYIFIAALVHNKNGLSDWSFVRNYGAYWDGLVKRNLSSMVKNIPDHYPPVYVKNYPSQGVATKTRLYGLPVYGTHHPNRAAHGMTGGACPDRGGDWAYYPWSNSGAGFPTNYEEITPLCDAIVIDMKLAVNLWASSWKEPKLGLANSVYKTHIVEYHMSKNIYGKYTDPYLLRTNATNPTMMDLTDDGEIVEPNETKRQQATVIKLNFTNIGDVISYNDVVLRSVTPTSPPLKTCPPVTCPPVTSCPPVTTCPPAPVAKTPEWGTNVLAIVCVVLALLVLELIAIIVILHRVASQSRGVKSKEKVRNANMNPAFAKV